MTNSKTTYAKLKRHLGTEIEIVVCDYLYRKLYLKLFPNATKYKMKYMILVYLLSNFAQLAFSLFEYSR